MGDRYGRLGGRMGGRIGGRRSTSGRLNSEYRVSDIWKQVDQRVIGIWVKLEVEVEIEDGGEFNWQGSGST